MAAAVAERAAIETSSRSVVGTLRRAYGVIRVSSTTTKWITSDPDISIPLELVVRPATMLGSDVCALAAATMPFAQFVERCNALEQSHGTQPTEVLLQAVRIEKARARALEVRSKCQTSEALASLLRNGTYWLLRIYESQWLVQEFPAINFEKLPSIGEDRHFLANAHDRDPKTVAHALARAKLRDQKWYQNWASKVRKGGKKPHRKRPIGGVHREEWVIKVKQLFEERARVGASYRDLRPPQISVDLALPLKFVQQVFKHHGLRERLVALPSDALRKKVRSLVRALERDGHAVTEASVVDRIRGTVSANVSRQVGLILQELSAE